MSERDDERFVEITRVGGWLRVAVLDGRTGREAVVHGPVDADEAQLVQLALRRLQPRQPKTHGGAGLLV